jgi:arylsulfatase
VFIGKFAASSAMALILASVSIDARADDAAGSGAAVQGMGRTVQDNPPPAWPKSPEAPAGAPNVLLIMTDDVGFAASTAFGGLIPTPNFDTLAKSGLRYNRFHTTALCSPTRASLLTGREPHKVGMGNVTHVATSYPGYTSVIPKSAGMISETLRENGFDTAAFGKWHVAPDWEDNPLGPFDHWPNMQGFNHFYGFISGDSDQYHPSLYENMNPIAPPENDPDYILDKDLASHAIRWLNMQHDLAPGRPFFLYYATGTAHAPHSAPPEWLAKFRGKFDQGWDKTREEIFAKQKKLGIIPKDTRLTERPDFLPAWSSLSPERKKVEARFMEAYAAALAYADDQIGRVIQHLREEGQLDNTLILFIQGDNGSSAEGGEGGLIYEQSFMNGFPEDPAYQIANIDKIGGPDAFNHFPASWAWAMNTPFQYYKQVASHLGGIRNGLVVSWPSKIKDAGAIRSQFLNVEDIVPTILDATGVKQPEVVKGVKQLPLDGKSFADSFQNAKALSKPGPQVFEMFQNMGIYENGWWAGSRPFAAPWTSTLPQKSDPNSREWELYNLDKDFSQAVNLAKANPDKLEQMKELFWKEAEKANILPIHGWQDGGAGMPSLTAGRNTITFRPGITRLGEANAPKLIGRSYKITADIDLSSADTNGVIVTQGGKFGGYALYFKNGVPIFHYNAIGDHQYRIAAKTPLAPGRHELVARFVADEAKPGSGGMMTLLSDGKEIASGRIERTHRVWVSIWEGFDVGEDTLTPINGDYRIKDSKFTGTLDKVTFEF